MVKEFIEGVHLNKHDKLNNTERYLIYLRNQYQSKAFQVGFFTKISKVIFFLRAKIFSNNHTNFSKFIYSIHLFLAVHTFIYELWSKCYTKKNLVFKLDNQILHLR